MPAAGYKSIKDAGIVEHLKYLTMPAVALGFIESGLMIRMTRSSMLDVLNSDYIRMAKAKGVSNISITIKQCI